MGRKTFYTQRDIEDLVAQGATSLTLTDDMVLTDMARDRAAELGLPLLDGVATGLPPTNPAPTLSPPDADLLSARIKATVLARMGAGVPEALLDAIIPKILAEIQARQFPKQN